MASAKKDDKKKPVSKGQANAVAELLKSQKAGGNGSGSKNVGAPLPKPDTNPVTSDDDGDESQGA